MYGDVPPLALTDWLEAAPTVALVSELGDRVTVGADTVRLSVPLVAENGPVPVLLSVAVIAKLKLPEEVGVPLSVPPVLRLRPGGSEPEASA